jgi:membrane protease YdiL (CAAX protease family)
VHRSKALREVLATYSLVVVACFALTRLRGIAELAPYVPVAIAAVFLATAIRLAQREPNGARRFGIALGGLLEPPTEDTPRGFLGLVELARTLRRSLPSAMRETAIAIGIAAIVFPPFAFGFHAFHQPTESFVLMLPEDPIESLLGQLVVVALPEEAFFRGYVQTRLGDAFPAKRTLFGADVSLAALAGQSALFALVHIAVDPYPERLAVFFPGLLFGWLRARRGGMGAALVLHALSNLFSETLARGWLG